MFSTPGVRKVTETEERDGNVITTNSIQLSKYLNPEPYHAIGIKGQSSPHFMFHRPLSYYHNLFFEDNFVLDGMEEPSFQNVTDKFDWLEIPPVLILRFRKR